MSEAMLHYMKPCLKKQKNSKSKQEQQTPEMSVYHTQQLHLDVIYYPNTKNWTSQRQGHLKHQDMNTKSSHQMSAKKTCIKLSFLLPEEVNVVFQGLRQDFLTHYVDFVSVGIQINSHQELSPNCKDFKLSVKEASSTLIKVGSRGRRSCRAEPRPLSSV